MQAAQKCRDNGKGHSNRTTPKYPTGFCRGYIDKRTGKVRYEDRKYGVTGKYAEELKKEMRKQRTGKGSLHIRLNK